MVQCGVPVDLSNPRCRFTCSPPVSPIVPGDGAPPARDRVKFVLDASGHVAGVVNPASRGKRNYWVNPNLGAEPDDRRRGTGHPGKLVARLEPLV